MPSPFTWDIAKPAGTDALSIGDDQIRSDKTSLRDVLRTLVPFGAPTIGWRNVQIGNDNYLVHNAKYDGANWSHDDTAVDAIGFRYNASGTTVDVVYRLAAASTWTTWIISTQFKGLISGANFIQLVSAATGALPALLALGSDTNVALAIITKGTGSIFVYTNSSELQFEIAHIASAVNRLVARGSVTGVGSEIFAAGSDTNISIILTPKGSGVVDVNGTAVRIGTNPAAAGAVRIANAVNISGRNAANSADVSLIQASSGDRVLISPGAADIQWGVALVALGGGAAPTFGTIGGAGPATAAQNTWMRVVDSAGAAFWVPAWK